MTNKLLSICIPTYNRAIKLDKGLKNLFDILNKIENWNEIIEIHVSDNASTDSTEEVCKNYLNGINYYKQEKNKGYDGNVLFLYNTVKTKYMFLLSDDDEILEKGLLKLLEVLLNKDKNYECVLCNFITIQDEKIINGFEIFKNISDETTMNEVKEKPFYFLSSFVLKKTDVDNNIILKETIATQMNIALEILNKDSEVYIMREYLIKKIEPAKDDFSGCNIPETIWKVHMGFLRVRRKYQNKFEIKIEKNQEESIILSMILEYLRSKTMEKSKKIKILKDIMVFYVKEYGFLKSLYFILYVLRKIMIRGLR